MALQRTRNELPTCSFCGKRKDEVDKLLAGPDVNICDECVTVCVKIVNGSFKGEEGNPVGFMVPERVRQDEPTCTFCRKRHGEVNKLIAGPDVNICDECVILCAEIVSEHRARRAARPGPKAQTSKEIED